MRAGPKSVPARTAHLAYRPSCEVPRAERAQQSPPLELELKLTVTADDIETVRNNPSLRRRLKESGVKRELVSVYLDTKDWALRRHAFSFRLRRDGDRLTQTIKGMRRGVLERAEWETPYRTGVRDHHSSMEALFEQLSDQKFPTALKAIFKTKIERTSYRVGGIEVALDKGRVIAGRRFAPVYEIELELKNGDRSALFALAREISKIVPAEISVKSKSERGYDLLEGGKPRAVMATETLLPAAVTVGEAFQIICNSCLCQLIANKAGILESVSEALHQMRVAIRRLQSAMKLFSEIASGRPAEHIAKELKWIFAELALARELDVFLSDVLVPLKKKYPAHINVAALYQACLKLRKKEYQRANAVLGSERYRMFLLAAAEWTEAGQWQTKPGDKSRPKLQQRATDVAAEEISSLRNKMKKGRQMEELNRRSLHKLRLRAKRLRYVIEFTESVFGDGQENSKRIDSALTSLKCLQSNLGALNDIDTEKGIFDRIAAERANNRKKEQQLGSSPAAKLMVGNQKQRKLKFLKKSIEAYDQFERLKPFWT